MGRLDQLDLSLKLSKAEESERLAAAQRRLAALRLALGGKLVSSELGPPVCILFEGWDAAGKGGAIKRLIAPLDLRHVRVAQFTASSWSGWKRWPPRRSGSAPTTRSPVTSARWPSRERS